MYEKRAQALEKYELTVKETARGRGTFICDTSQGEKVLVPFKGTKARAMFIKKYLDELNETGFVAERILLTAEGDALSDDGEDTYLLKDYIKGNECRVSVEEDTYKAMEIIGYYHKASETCEAGNENVTYLSCVDKAQKHIKELKKIRNYIKGRNKKNEFELMFQKNYEHYMECAQKAIEYKRTQNEIRCHGQLNQHNILNVDGQWRIVNFEHIVYTTPMIDVSEFLRKISEKNQWNCKVGENLLSIYDKVCPLSEAARKQLVGVMLFPEKFWKIADHYFGSHKAWIPKRDIEKLEKIISQEEERISFFEKVFSIEI